MKAILKKLPIIRGIIAKREQAALQARADADLAAYWAWWDAMSPEQQWRAFKGY